MEVQPYKPQRQNRHCQHKRERTLSFTFWTGGDNFFLLRTDWEAAYLDYESFLPTDLDKIVDR